MKPVLEQKWFFHADEDESGLIPWYAHVVAENGNTIAEVDANEYAESLALAQHIVDLHNASLEVCEWMISFDPSGFLIKTGCGYECPEGKEGAPVPVDSHSGLVKACSECRKPIKVVSEGG